MSFQATETHIAYSPENSSHVQTDESKKQMHAITGPAACLEDLIMLLLLSRFLKESSCASGTLHLLHPPSQL